ncbi:ubiquitin-associated protein 1 [Chrysoperla carnea]|uniref:ubiquitin-associated protein 1 n=1 Tax=Chrysoperla carnea TaxID=189513 RepID=UPI001D0767ED|nr:ubiquitin-associated protein 1 [Chrysoperla carnea]
MAQKNSDPGYMDGIPVKISEKYKPPKRIILPTNTQRITANDIIQGPYFQYDYSLEQSVKSKMKELQQARKAIKLDRANKKCQEQNVRDTTDIDIPNTDSVSYPNDINDVITTSETVTTKTITERKNESILLPTQMTLKTALNHCDVPTPINISDFENDTASPFDNMELKTINDLAELAQVLQPTSVQAISSPNYTTTNMYCNNFNIKQNSGYDGTRGTPQYIPINDNRLPINGYYNTDYLITSQGVQNSVQLTLHNQNSYNHSTYVNESHHPVVSLSQNTSNVEDHTSNKSRSVPDIINSLHKDLMQTRIGEANAALNMQLKRPSPPAPQSVSCVSTSTSSSCGPSESSRLSNPYSTLSQRQQQICKDVAMMGFPLDRVSRACVAIGDDQSKLIEHMIVMSQLLDLGFMEENITKALLQCGNDRDKALDYLVA